MSALHDRADHDWPHQETEITRAAVAGFGRLLRAVPGKVRAHPSGDGGLICEDYTVAARPTMWRVSPDGTVLPDSAYNFLLSAFLTGRLPQGV